jgi:exosortase
VSQTVAAAGAPIPLPGTSGGTTARSACFALLVGLTVVAFWAPLGLLISFSLQREEYSHILLVPLVSVALFFLGRRRIFTHVETEWGAGLGLLVVGTLSYWIGHQHAASLSENDRLVVAMLPAVVILVGAFVLCYGIRAFRMGLFPVLFLFLMVPFPDVFLHQVIFWLQSWSAEVSYAVFELLGVPVFRTGFIFALPGLTIEVSEECSGIRSSMALLVTSLVVGHVVLRSGWRRAVLTVAILPMVIVKNAIRIVTLSLLSIYVDPSFITGRLHREGGIVFFLLAVMILAPFLWLLQKSEQPAAQHGKRT